MNLNAIIVDDELSARELLQELVENFCPNVSIVASFKNLETAVEHIRKNKPDLVFLDVEMPRYSGYEILDFFDEIDFTIIFVTAYDKYAIKAFEVSALDYLLKPVEIERLKSAVSRATEQKLSKSYQKKLSTLYGDMKKSALKYAYTDRGFTHSVIVEDIIAFEAQRSYTLLHMKNGKPVTLSKNIKTIETEVESFSDLVRIHRSWMVNKTHVRKYSKSTLDVILSNEIKAKVSRQHKAVLQEIVG
ncbi:MAG: LytR/AlgR family response regulator transcription factor [Crocinitomicaceae bacterium]